jgi:hypothetical protein
VCTCSPPLASLIILSPGSPRCSCPLPQSSAAKSRFRQSPNAPSIWGPSSGGSSTNNNLRSTTSASGAQPTPEDNDQEYNTRSSEGVQSRGSIWAVSEAEAHERLDPVTPLAAPATSPAALRASAPAPLPMLSPPATSPYQSSTAREFGLSPLYGLPEMQPHMVSRTSQAGTGSESSIPGALLPTSEGGATDAAGEAGSRRETSEEGPNTAA